MNLRVIVKLPDTQQTAPDTWQDITEWNSIDIVLTEKQTAFLAGKIIVAAHLTRELT